MPSTGGHVQVGGIPYIWTFARTQLEVSAIALGGALAVGMPIGLVLGHIGKGEYFAVGFGNAGRAVPEIAVVFLLAATHRHRPRQRRPRPGDPGSAARS